MGVENGRSTCWIGRISNLVSFVDGRSGGAKSLGLPRGIIRGEAAENKTLNYAVRRFLIAPILKVECPCGTRNFWQSCA